MDAAQYMYANNSMRQLIASQYALYADLAEQI
jgi:hypothetical protein